VNGWWYNYRSRKKIFPNLILGNYLFTGPIVEIGFRYLHHIVFYIHSTRSQDLYQYNFLQIVLLLPPMFLFYPHFYICIKTSKRIFRNFSSSNLENTFRSFFPRENNFGKRVSKYFFKGKNENLKGRKETWKVGRNIFF
jgi:hypothetical protein